MPKPFERVTHLFVSPRWVLAGGALLLIAMFSICGAILWDARQDAFDRAQDAARNTMLVIERDIARNIQLYDLSLQAVVDGVHDPRLASLPPDIRRGYLFDRAADAEYLGAVFVLDARGDIVMDSRVSEPEPANFADRDYFQAHVATRNAGLYVSHPYRSRMRQLDPSIALSRRIDNPDGSFSGIVVIAVQLEYFHHLMAGLALGPHGTMALIREDGTLLMRSPYSEQMIGRDLRGTGPFTKMSQAAEGQFPDVASIDGVKRIYSYRHLPGLPLIVEIATAETDIYANWRTRAWHIGIVMGAFGLAFAVLNLMFAYSLRQRARAESALMMLARLDSLTGLSNRRTLDELLEREWRRANRSGQPLSILFVDIDRFKNYNDTYGHQAGDDVLAVVAKCIAGRLSRAGDVAARYGGEEFVVVLPHTAREGALQQAETMRHAVAALGIAHAGSELHKVTVSIGVATWQADGHAEHAREHAPAQPGRTLAAVLRAADEALYRAKQTGRNRVFGVQVA
jgi:diguanylate cyclase (GGDEF)-like protein